jgi:hypothetical protein
LYTQNAGIAPELIIDDELGTSRNDSASGPVGILVRFGVTFDVFAIIEGRGRAAANLAK